MKTQDPTSLCPPAPDTHERTMAQMEEQWESHAIRAHVCRRMMDDIAQRPVRVPEGSGQETVPWSELEPILLAEKSEGGDASATATSDASGKPYKRLLERKKEGMCECASVCVCLRV